MVRRSLCASIASAAYVFVAGCDDTPTAPSIPPLIFVASLSPASEVPPVANAEANGRGAVQIQFDVTRDSGGAITSATARFHFQLNGFPGGTSVVGAHIHPGGANVNGPVIISAGLTAANALPLSSGFAEFSASGIPVTATLVQSIANNPAGFYFNVHSPLNPGGFARGQLTHVQ